MCTEKCGSGQKEKFKIQQYCILVFQGDCPFFFEKVINKYTYESIHLLTLVSCSRISYTLKMEALRSSETSVNTISERRTIAEYGIFQI
jgi:hypothetical protein